MLNTPPFSQVVTIGVYVRAGSFHEKLKEVKKDIQNDEITRAKAYIEGIMTIRSETQVFLNNYIGENYLYNNQYIDINEYNQGIRIVDKKDLLEVAEKYFQADNMLLVELVPQ